MKRSVPGWLAPILLLVACAGGGGGSSNGATANRSCHPTGAPVALVAHNTAFDTHCLAARANTPLKVQFDNEDGGVQHDLAVYSANPADIPDARLLFKGRIVQGPAMITYTVPGVPAGMYHFRCTIHPEPMSGTFVVEEP